MKLQPKKSIQADLTTQRKAQIDEGKKLASKIDALRETLASEEGALSRFRSETIQKVQAEIDSKIRELDVLNHELLSLNEKKRLALLPLDTEWEEIRKSKVKLEKEKQAWGEKSYFLTEREEQIEQKEQEIENERGRTQEYKHSAAENLAKSQQILASAREEAANMRNKAQAVLSLAEVDRQDVQKREESVTLREELLVHKEKKLERYEIELAKREQTLRAGWKILERTKQKLNG